MRDRLVLRSLVLAVIVLLGGTARAQCTSIGPGCASSGMDLLCVSAPQVGTTWTIGERDATACGALSTNPITIHTVAGFCQVPGLPLGAPLMCPNCTGCELNVLPILADFMWTWPPRTTTLQIPNNASIVGAVFCIQDACVDMARSCVCVSNAMQVTIQP